MHAAGMRERPTVCVCAQIAFTGFCILSGFALLMLLMDSLLVSAPAKSSVQHADAAKPAAAETDAAEAV